MCGNFLPIPTVLLMVHNDEDSMNVGKGEHLERMISDQASFSQTHKIGIITVIANLVFLYICSFLLFSYKMMLVNICENRYL